MSVLGKYYKEHWILGILLICVPASVIAGLLHANPVWVFGLALVAFAPLANLIGVSTEILAEKTGPRIGGLINASLGNLPELVVTLVALKAGLTEFVLGNIAGAFTGNILFVLGLAMIVGGWKHGEQTFSHERANTKTHYMVVMGAIMLLITVLELLSPGVITQKAQLDNFSDWLAIILLVLYGAYIVSTLLSTSGHAQEQEGVQEKWSVPTTLGVLAVAAVGVFVVSHFLVESIEAVTQALPISEAFIGFIIVPVVGNAAEHLVAVTVASKNMMGLAVEIAVGSAIQIMGLITPVVILAATAFGNPIELTFNGPQVVAIIVATLLGVKVLSDAKTNWEEGLAGILGFVAIAIMFYELF